ncbi:hypothetical protein NA56DRAFT_657972 [Hyaloscypha hepaticicola]|uniref:C2H2-type domain-containing protein n=1 Tax=Hyaloscypha hepaticicola TaxID=2082293 RepID=A0A2J6Q8K6_9HELO|nr:hypothetical protein NA56DRAFT_657972 [Hyaloscypha hepaticicola]
MSSTSTLERPVSSEFGGNFSNEVCGNHPDDEGLVEAASQIDNQFQDPTSHTNSELSFDFAPQVETTSLYSIPENQYWYYNTADSDTIPNEFGLHSQADAIVGSPMFNGFDCSTNNDTLSHNITSEGMELWGSLDTASGAPPENTEMDLSFNSFDQNTASDIFDLDMPDQNLQAYPTIPSPNPETSLSSEFDLTTSLRTPDPHSPSMASSSNTSPTRQFCGLCRSTFKRPGDLKRHEKVHFPERRSFHCWQYGCERNGRKGFYRRDKLRDHEKQVHGM